MTQSESPADYLPPSVKIVLDELLRLTGQAPQLHRVNKRLWRITQANSRVVMTADLRQDSQGRIHWADSTLKVDGKNWPLAQSIEHFAQIFNDPSHSHEPIPIEPMPPERPISEAPLVVQHQYRQLAGKVGSHVALKLGKRGREWVIGLETAKNSLQLSYQQARGKVWALAGRRPIQAIIDGVDQSRAVEGSLEEALRLLSGAESSESPNTPRTTGATAAAAKTNSVAVRRATVIRN
jgi:hypothetical protein